MLLIWILLLILAAGSGQINIKQRDGSPKATNEKHNQSDTQNVVLVDILRDASQIGVTVRINGVNFLLFPNQHLVHPNFVVLHRHDNGSIITVPEQSCHYRTPPTSQTQLAVDICDGLHGVILANQDLYHIHPFPKTAWTNHEFNIPHLIQHVKIDKATLEEIEQGNNRRRRLARVWNEQKKSPSRRKRTINRDVKIETAVFVDRDLLRYMQTVFPTDTERHLLRFVLATFNAVQILYQDSSLGARVDFVLKRLEILHTEPTGLQRPSDIDRYLNSFCSWQEGQQPQGGSPLSWDHALMLTGLDLYVISKSGRISNQVVGLAPVAGMCLPRSSCTVNEGRHFESVFVVAHEIGHNLGMRHDGPSAENECDPADNIMAPTLGSGRFTWSTCSRRYLQQFLQTSQAKCLFESSGPELDHFEGGILPGQRFDSNTQCTLKHGPGSVHAPQGESDTCKDLRCTKERFTWAAHPALEGTICSTGMWCRGGQCVAKDLLLFAGGPRNGGWSEWSPLSECASACLRDSNTRHESGSTGISVAYRRCNNPRPENDGKPCLGSDKRYQTCKADQCENLATTTINDFAEAICRRAKDVEKDLTGNGKQKRTSDKEEACTVWCDSRNGGVKSRGWIFPDGTACGDRTNPRRHFYCIGGKCEEFHCVRNGTFIAGAEKCASSPLRMHAKWTPVGPCHSNCIQPGRGLRILKKGPELNIQLCQLEKTCVRRRTVYDYANKVCSKFSERVNKLSGLGLQLSQSPDEPDRSCQVACQDSETQSRFYLVTGEDGWFPFGTDCSKGLVNGNAYCVSGKCLEFGTDDLPVIESQFVFPNIKRKRSLEVVNRTVIAKLDNTAVAKLIESLHTASESETWESTPTTYCLDWDNPIHVDDKPLPDYEIA